VTRDVGPFGTDVLRNVTDALFSVLEQVGDGDADRVRQGPDDLGLPLVPLLVSAADHQTASPLN